MSLEKICWTPSALSPSLPLIHTAGVARCHGSRPLPWSACLLAFFVMSGAYRAAIVETVATPGHAWSAANELRHRNTSGCCFVGVCCGFGGVGLGRPAVASAIASVAATRRAGLREFRRKIDDGGGGGDGDGSEFS